jgi:hypothetical protein
LRLPPASVGWLTAKNSFYNLPKYRDDVLAQKAPSADHIDTITGIIAELTEEAPGSTTGAMKTLFTTIFCGARLIALTRIMHHSAPFCTPARHACAAGRSDWTSVQQLKVQRVWG